METGATLKVEFDQSMEDVVALNDHLFRHSTTLRRLRWVVLVPTLVLLTLFLAHKAIEVASELRSREEKAALFTCVGVIWIGLLLAVPLAIRPLNSRIVRSLMGEGRGRTVFGPRVVTITPKELIEDTNLSHSTIKWAGVYQVQCDGTYLHLLLSAATAISIPKSAFCDEAAFLRFADTAREYHRTAAPGPCKKCGYDMTANTSGQCPECGEAIAS